LSNAAGVFQFQTNSYGVTERLWEIGYPLIVLKPSGLLMRLSASSPTKYEASIALSYPRNRHCPARRVRNCGSPWEI
jgi:hypothetical protein